MTLHAVRRTIEQLKTAELTNYFQDPCLAAGGARAPGRHSTNARTAVLYPIAFEDRLTILISIADVLSAESIRVPRADVVRTVTRFAARCRIGEMTNRSQPGGGTGRQGGEPDHSMIYSCGPSCIV